MRIFFFCCKMVFLFFDFWICHVLSFQMSLLLSIFRDDKFLTLSVVHPIYRPQNSKSNHSWSWEDKSFIVVKLTSELSLRGRLRKKFTVLVSTKICTLEKYKTAFTSTMPVKQIFIVTAVSELQSIKLSQASDFKIFYEIRLLL